MPFLIVLALLLFERFVLAVRRDDAGDQAAREVLGIALGGAVALLVQQPGATGWEPDPTRWDGPARTGSAVDHVDAGEPASWTAS